MTNRFEELQQGQGQQERFQMPGGGPAFRDAYNGQWQGQFSNPNSSQFTEAQANDQGYLNVPGGQALYGDQGGFAGGQGHHCGHHGGRHFQGGEPGQVGPDGQVIGQSGQPGQPEIGPDGQPLPMGHRRGGHHGHGGHHNPLDQLNTQLTGDSALTPDQVTQIQTIMQQTGQSDMSTVQDLKSQKTQLQLALTSGGDPSSFQSALTTDMTNLSNAKISEMQSIYGVLTPHQLQIVNTNLQNRQSQRSTDGTNSGSTVFTTDASTTVPTDATT